MLDFLEKIFSPSKIEVKIEKFEWVKKDGFPPDLWNCVVEGRFRYTYFWGTKKEYLFKVKKYKGSWYYHNGKLVDILSGLYEELCRINQIKIWEAEEEIGSSLKDC